MRRLAIAAALAALLAGCSAAAPGPGPAPEQPAAAPHVVKIPVFMGASLGNQSGPLPFIVNTPPPVSDGGPIEVGPGAAALLVEARWSCGTPACRFEFELEDPDDRDVARFSTGGPVRFEVPPEALGPGKWDVVLRPDSANAQVAGEIRASVFKGRIPPGYTAF